MSLTPTRMKRVDAVILQKDVRRATLALGKLGVLHLVEVKPEETAAPMRRVGSSDDLARCTSLITRLETFREKLRLSDLPEAQVGCLDPVAAIEEKMTALEERVNAVLAERTRLEGESEGLQDTLARLRALDPLSIPLARMAESPFVHFAVGTLGASALRRVAAEARRSVVIVERPGGGPRRDIIAVTSRKGRFALNTLLENNGFVPKDTSGAPQGDPAQALAELEQRIQTIQREHRRIQREQDALARKVAPEIAAFRHRLRLEQALIEAEMNFGHTASTCLISGWLPENCVAAVSQQLLEATDGKMILRVSEPDEVGASPASVPVLMKNHPLIRPFELLVNGFGLPRYKEVEPTVIVAASFLVMYGLMFGDVGHGLLLALVGFLVRRLSRKPQVRDVATIIGFAGLAAMFAGFLYGSVFGLEFLPALWIRPMDEMMRFLLLAVAGGVLLISAGVVLNIVNRFRAGDYAGAIFHPFGIVGIIFYWGAVTLVMRYLFAGSTSTSTLHVVLLLLVPLVILFFRGPIQNLFARKKHGDGTGAFSMLMEGAVEVMDTVATYLANTVSFARVAAFALAHAGLCVAVLSMTEIAGDVPGGIFWQGLVFVLGTALVLLLEGLIVFVQCLRLEYYEFFGKFFEGSGKKYQPFKIT